METGRHTSPQRVGAFVAAVAAWQADLGLSDAAFAAHLGITKGYWSLLRRGLRGGRGGVPGGRFVDAVLARRPELEFYLTADLRRRRQHAHAAPEREAVAV